MKGQRFRQPIRRLPSLPVLMVMLVLALTTGGAPLAAQRAPLDAQPASTESDGAFRSSPVMFIQNAGQWPEAARFQVWGGTAGTMWLAEDAIWLTVVERLPAETSERFAPRHPDPERANVQRENVQRKTVNIKLSFVGANPHPRIEPFDRLDTVVSYFIGNEPDRWRPDVPVWGGVRYVGLYPGVNLEVMSEGGQMVQRLAAQPGADLRAVRLRVEGADVVAVDGGALRLGTAAGEVAWPLLRVDGRPITGPQVQARSMGTFEVGEPFTARLPLPYPQLGTLHAPTDNPADLIYGTYLGGSNDIAVDSTGNAYVAGSGDSTLFPTTPGTFITSDYGAFVVKLNSAASSLIYVTFLGGSGYDEGKAVALDASGAAHVVGTTNSSDFPVTPGSFDGSHGGGYCHYWVCYDLFVVKLGSNGDRLVFGTYLGGNQDERQGDIAVDQKGLVYVTGATESSDFPITGNAFDPTFVEELCFSYTYRCSDALLSKFSADGRQLLYSTFIGGRGSSNSLEDGRDSGYAIAVDGNERAVVVGDTNSIDFPTTAGAFDRSRTGYTDGFITRVDTVDGRPIFSTLFGGSKVNSVDGVAAHSNGNVMVVVRTTSSDFPTTNGAFDRSYNGDTDVVVAQFNATGGLAFSTFLGGASEDKPFGVAIDNGGQAALVGTTQSTAFPTTQNALDRSFNGESSEGDAFTTLLNTSGSRLLYSSFIGGRNGDSAQAISLDVEGFAYITGGTNSADFPTTQGAYDTSFDEGSAFVVKLAMGGAVVHPTPTPVPTYAISGRVTEAGGFTGIGGVTVWAGATRSTTTDANGNYTFTGLPAGTYAIRPEKAPYAFSPPSRTVTVPADQMGVDFRRVAITKIQVNQVLGNTTNYVAGKDTVIQVMLSDRVPYDPANQQVVVKRNGAYITTLKPIKSAFPTQTLNFWGKMEDCGNWEQGSYTFEATVNGSQMVQDAGRFSERRSLRILAVPVKIKVNGQVLIPSDRWKSAEEFVRQTYPVANKGILYQPADRMLDGTFWDLTTEGGRTALFLKLSLYQPVSCTLGLGPCYDAIFGIIPQTQLCPSGPCTEGWTSWPPAAVVMDKENLPAIMAHELGHMVGYNHLFVVPGLGDEYSGLCGVFQCDDNPPPQNYLGKTSTYGSCSQHCSDPTVQPWDAWKGSAVLPEDSPFEVGGRLGLGRKLSFMGASGENQSEYWVTPHAYDSLFGQLAPRAGAAATQAIERVADVRGWVQKDDHGALAPAYYLDAVAPAVAAGPYSVEVLDVGGATLSSQGFDVSFVLLSNPPQDIDQAYFRVAVRFPQGARTLRVKHGSTVLTEMTISAHAPTLSLTAPTAGQTWAATGNYTIRWQGSDLDGDALHYTVLYRQGASDWIVLGADLTADELSIDAAGLPGGTAAQVQVWATDGINTTTAESGRFTVGRKGPEAFITYPAEGASFMPGASFFLRGTAYDLEDGRLPDSAYRWTSNRDGDLGTGASNLVILSPGPHIITLMATDSDGNTAVKMICLSAGSQQFMPLISRSH